VEVANGVTCGRGSGAWGVAGREAGGKGGRVQGLREGPEARGGRVVERSKPTESEAATSTSLPALRIKAALDATGRVSAAVSNTKWTQSTIALGPTVSKMAKLVMVSLPPLPL